MACAVNVSGLWMAADLDLQWITLTHWGFAAEFEA